MNSGPVDVAKLISGILNRVPVVERELLYKRWQPSWGEGLPESDEDAISWLTEGGAVLLTQILRRTDVTNDELRVIVEIGVIKLANPKGKPRPEARLVAFSAGLGAFPAAGVPLDQLAVMSATVLELTLDVATALEPFAKDTQQPEELRPPSVSVSAGSVQFTVGGPLLASGVGLAVAVSAGLLVSPIAVPAAAFIAATGVVDVAVGWWKSIGEGKKARMEAAKTTVDTPTREEAAIKRALDRRQQELAILKAEKELAAMTEISPASSSLVPPEEVRRQADLWGLSEPACTHLLNRSLAKAVAARRMLGGMDAIPGGGENARRRERR